MVRMFMRVGSVWLGVNTVCMTACMDNGSAAWGKGWKCLLFKHKFFLLTLITGRFIDITES